MRIRNTIRVFRQLTAAAALLIAGLFAASPSALAGISGPTPWAVLRCKLSDQMIPSMPDAYYADLFTSSGAGKGGLYDYWNQISMGHISLYGTQVLPWVPINVTVAQDALRGQQKQVQDCVDATEVYIQANHLPVDLSKFYGLFVLQNALGGEVGAAPGVMPVIINKQPAKVAIALFEVGALNVMNAGHEMGHGYGLGHAEDKTKNGCGGGPGEYCDYWDVMGAPFNGGTDYDNAAFDLPLGWHDSSLTGGESGPGLNAQHLSYLGWIPSGRSAVVAANTQCVTLQLAALGHPEVLNSATEPTYYQVGIPPSGNFPGYTVEFRRAVAWDRHMPDSVIIHSGWSLNGDAETFIMDTIGGALWHAGDKFTDTANDVEITIDSFDLTANTAKITICRPGTPPPPVQPQDCQLVFSCHNVLFGPPDYTVSCPVEKDFYHQLPAGELTFIGTGTIYSGRSSDYDESIRACNPETSSCSQYSVWKGPQDWCPSPGRGGGGGCPGQKGPCGKCPGGICQ